jgi:hypothetical protein
MMVDLKRALSTAGLAVSLSLVALVGTACVAELDNVGEHTAALDASEVAATITAATCGNADGGVSLVVTGMNPPFTYLWSTMDTTDSITDVASGTYTVTVTDALMDTVDLTYRVGNEAEWTNLVGTSVGAGNALTKTGTLGWNAGAVTDQVLDADTDGEIYVDINANSVSRFVAGLSDSDDNASYTSIDFALYYTGTSMLMFENGAYQGSAGAAATGDRFRIERSGTDLNYYKNDAVVRTTTVAADIALIPDVSMYDTTAVVTELTTSFCSSSITLDASTTSSTCGGATGTITVTPSGGAAPYTYAWDHGPTTAMVTGLAPGDYTVTVMDALSRSAQDTYTVTSNSAGWARLAGTSFDGGSGTLTKTAATGWGNSGGSSAGSLGDSEDGHVEFDILAINGDRYMIGLSADDADDHYNTIDYAIYYAAGGILIYEDGVYQGGFGAATVSDVYRVAREGSNIVYYRNDTALRTVATDPADSLFVDFSIYYLDAQITGLATTFCQGATLDVSAALTPPSCGGSDGVIDLTVNTGSPPFTFDWAHGPTTEDVTGLDPGDYSVTVTDALSQTFDATYSIGYSVSWSSLTNVTWDAPSATLTKTGSIGWTAGGASGDTLAPSTDGWVSFDVPTLQSERYFMGLSDSDGGVSFATIGYAMYYTAGRVYLYESGSYTGVSVAPSAGDQFTLAREGSDMVYYQNDTAIRTVAGDAMIDMVVDFSMYDAGGEITNVLTSFCTAP